MEKRLTVGVFEDIPLNFLKIQLEQLLANNKKVLLGELIRVAVNSWFHKTQIPTQK